MVYLVHSYIWGLKPQWEPKDHTAAAYKSPALLIQPHSLSLTLCFSLFAKDKAEHPESILCHLLMAGRAGASRPVLPEPLARQDAATGGLHSLANRASTQGTLGSALHPWSWDLTWPKDHPRRLLWGDEYRLSRTQTNKTHFVWAIQRNKLSCSSSACIFHLATT